MVDNVTATVSQKLGRKTRTTQAAPGKKVKMTALGLRAN